MDFGFCTATSAVISMADCFFGRVLFGASVWGFCGDWIFFGVVFNSRMVPTHISYMDFDFITARVAVISMAKFYIFRWDFWCFFRLGCFGRLSFLMILGVFFWRLGGNSFLRPLSP